MTKDFLHKKTELLAKLKEVSYNVIMEVRAEEYFRNSLSDVLKVPAIYTIHYFRYGKNFKFPLERHPFWELVFIDSGKAKITADDKTFFMNQGEVCFHAPDVVHTISTEDDFCNSAIVSFEASGRMTGFFENGIFKLNDYEKRLLSDLINEGKVAFVGRLDDPNLTRMRKNEYAPFGSGQFIKNTLELLLISIIRSNLPDNSPKSAESASASAHADRIVERIIALLKSRVSTDITLDEIASELFFSKTYIKTVFKKRVGKSIIKYYNELKIDEAKKLISLNKYSVTEITSMLGFSSVHYFSRLFKKCTDMTPTEYNRSIKAENVLQ